MNLSLGSNALNFKAHRSKFGFGSMLFLLVFGGAFLGTGILLFKSNHADPSWTKISGHITAVSSHISDGANQYSPVVTYAVNGQSYTVASSVSSSSYPALGQAREVAYNPAHPGQAKVIESGGAMWFLYVAMAIGAFFICLAPYLYIRSLRRGSSINALVQTGRKLQGVMVDIQSQGNESGTYKIVVAADDGSGAVQNYTSDSLTGIGSLAMADFRNSPIPIDVYIDPANPQNYYVDISDIPNLTPERIKDLLQAAATRQSTSMVSGGNNTTPPQPPTVPTPPASQV
jgi:hypothetical protein